MTQNVSPHQAQVAALTQTRFVFHAWKDLSLIIPDGIMSYIDTPELDVDLENVSSAGQKGGISFLKRLRLVPMTTTQKSVINNKEGFAVSNVFVGSMGPDGQPLGLGSNMSGARKTNVKGEWHYPEQKLMDLGYTFGKFGLVAVRSLVATSEKEKERCQEIAAVVFSGIGRDHLLEDLPEYFHEDGAASLFIPDKRPARFAQTAVEIVQKAADGGVKVALPEIDKTGKVVLRERLVKLNAVEYTSALHLVGEFHAGVMGAHAAALDIENNGVLPQTRDGIQTGKKRSYDALDQWLMKQFPSFPMDTELEKSQKQLMRALEATAPAEDVPPGYVSREQYEAVLKQNETFEARLAALEKGAK